jgi:hypothetical protein
MSPVVATLIPICNANEELNANLARRHSLEIRRNSPLVLGRNAITGIASHKIPALVATISWIDDYLWLERHSQDCSIVHKHSRSVVPLSGKLEDGHVVRLYKQEYAYRVQISDTKETVESSAAIFTETSEECMCAVCMEIMVQSTAVVPCGHLYCKECLVGITECPNCRLAIQSTLPVKTMDNVIEKLVKSGNVFSGNDVKEYESRMKPLVDVSAAQPPPPKRARKSRTTTDATPSSVDLTVPRAGDTAEAAICID